MPLRAGAMSSRPRVLATRHGDLNWARQTLVMGILNITPDSFYDGSRRMSVDSALAAGIAMAQAGAHIIDIGGESTRPGAQAVSQDEEMARVLPVVRELRRAVNVPIAIDTYKEKIAREALRAGADIVNDISALNYDSKMVSLVAGEGVPVVLMHMQGTPRTMQAQPHYHDVVSEVRDFLAARVRYAVNHGVSPEAIVVDPGIGFGKTLEHNLALLRGLPILSGLGHPLLVGASRKTFIGKILDLEPQDRLEGSLAAAVAAVLAGANLVRTHDVAETVKAVRVADAIRYGAATK